MVNEIIKQIISNPNWETVLEKIKKNEFCKEKANEVAKMLGFNFLGSGNFRFVIEVNGLAVKIPLQAVGIYDNEEEANIWKSLPNEAKKYFVPYLGGDSFFGIYEKADLINPQQYNAKYKDKVLKELEQINVEVEDLEGYDQWGYIGNKLLILDYTETIID